MRRCFRCSSEVPEEFRYCGRCGAPITDPDSATLLLDNETPDELLRRVRLALDGEYEVEAELGRGGMAVVYRATDVRLNRPVALKVLAPEPHLAAKRAERFRREGRLVAALEHPNIIPVYRVDQVGGILFLAMKLIDGRSLDAIIDHQGPLPVPVALAVLTAAARGLAFAHGRGIVHRDVKAANILVDGGGHVVVSDFGLALQSSDVNLTTTGTMMGTPLYMSPEQCSGRRLGPQSDQYSLGVVAFQMLTGKVPFYAETLAGLMHHHFFTPMPDIRRARDDLPQPVVDLVTRVLAKAPVLRFDETSEMVAAIEAVPVGAAEGDTRRVLGVLAQGGRATMVSWRPLPPLPDVPSEALTRLPGRTPTLLWALPVAAAVLVVALGLGASGLWRRGGDRTVAGQPSRTAALAPPIDSVAPPPTPAADTPAPRPAQRSGRSRPTAPAEATGMLRVRTVPSDAEILVDGRHLGVGAVVDEPVTVGPRRLEARATGYRSFDTTVTFVANARVNLGTITLRASGGPE
ncbi:MAG: protein kinase domain-containing protein [Gemmatimonadales bacterium]